MIYSLIQSCYLNVLVIQKEVGNCNFFSLFFLGCTAILAAAQQRSSAAVFVVLYCCCVDVAKSFDQLENQDLGSFLNFVSSFATQKGMASFKSAATPFFYNSGTVSHRKLKFRI